MTSLGEYIKSNKSIALINMNYCHLSDTGIETLVRYLSGNSTLKKICFHGIKEITNQSIPSLLIMIQSSNLEYVDVDETCMTRKNALVPKMAHNVLKNAGSNIDFKCL